MQPREKSVAAPRTGPGAQFADVRSALTSQNERHQQAHENHATANDQNAEAATHECRPGTTGVFAADVVPADPLGPGVPDHFEVGSQPAQYDEETQQHWRNSAHWHRHYG